MNYHFFKSDLDDRLLPKWHNFDFTAMSNFSTYRRRWVNGDIRGYSYGGSGFREKRELVDFLS